MKKSVSSMSVLLYIAVLCGSGSNSASAFAAQPLFFNTLARGASGPAVIVLQQFLKAMPDVYPAGPITGYFGLLTDRAVKRFQSKYGIEPSGVVGPKTRKKLGELFLQTQNANQGQAQPSSHTQAHPMFFRGTAQSSGSNARIWNAPTEGTGGSIMYAENLPACAGTELFTSTGSPPNTILKPCSYSFLLTLKSGEEIGTAGGPGTLTYLQSFDFGVYDQRIQSLPFIDPKYWTPLNLHAVCGLYYYSAGSVKTSLLNELNNTKKDANGLPDCGTNMWDKTGTAEGNWVLPHTPTGRVPDRQGLAAIHLNTDPGQGLIDWGSGIAQADRIQFTITTSGVLNRDPADVTADGLIYCFQSASQSHSYGATYAHSVLLQLVNDDTLKAEHLTGGCPTSPTFSNPTTYIR